MGPATWQTQVVISVRSQAAPPPLPAHAHTYFCWLVSWSFLYAILRVVETIFLCQALVPPINPSKDALQAGSGRSAAVGDCGSRGGGGADSGDSGTSNMCTGGSIRPVHVHWTFYNQYDKFGIFSDLGSMLIWQHLLPGKKAFCIISLFANHCKHSVWPAQLAVLTSSLNLICRSLLSIYIFTSPRPI